jgi:hypothetical protein
MEMLPYELIGILVLLNINFPNNNGDGLATFTDADSAHCLQTCHSVSAQFHLLNCVFSLLGLQERIN